WPRRAGTARRLALEARGGLRLERRHRLEGRFAEPVSREAFGDPPGELAERARERLVVGRTGVPPVRPPAFLERDRMLHEGNPSPLDRARDEDLRPFRLVAEVLEHIAQFAVVMPIADLDEPAEPPQLLLQVPEPEDLLRRPVRLQLVPVDDHDQVADDLVRAGLQRLPVLPLLELAVPGHDDDATATPEEAFRPCHAAA